MSRNSTVRLRDWSGLFMLPWLFCIGLGVLYMTTHPPPVRLSRPGAAALSPVAAAPRIFLHPIAPVHLARFRAPKGQSADVRFTWELERPEEKSADGAMPLFFELSSNANFTGGATRVVQLAGLSTTETMQPVAVGRHFWRVRAGRTRLSETRELFVDEDVPVAVEQALGLSTPENGQEFFEGDSPEAMAFSWRAKDLSTRPGFAYALDLSSQADFSGSPITLTTKSDRIVGQKLKLTPGRYFWRVRLVDPSGATVETSDAFRFSYLRRPAPLPPQSKVRVQSSEPSPSLEGAEEPPRPPQSKVRVKGKAEPTKARSLFDE